MARHIFGRLRLLSEHTIRFTVHKHTQGTFQTSRDIAFLQQRSTTTVHKSQPAYSDFRIQDFRISRFQIFRTRACRVLLLSRSHHRLERPLQTEFWLRKVFEAFDNFSACISYFPAPFNPEIESHDRNAVQSDRFTGPSL